MAQNHQRPSRRAVSSAGRGWILALSVTAALGSPAPALAEDPNQIDENRIVGEAVFEALERESRAKVVIAFELPPAPEGMAITDLTSPEGKAAVVAAADAILQSIRPGALLLQHRFESIRVLGGEITADGLLDLLNAPGVVRVDLAVGGSIHLAQAVPLVNLNHLQAQGFTGMGVTVAVLDSGYDSDHPDLSDNLVGEACFCGGGCCPNGSSNQTGAGSAEDDHGHGSHVAGIITSRGLQAPKGGAPDAGVVAVKVVDSAGHFQSSLDVAAALDWVRNWTAARVVNLSLGTHTLYSGTCDNADAGTMAFRDAINNLYNHGVAVFAASGNNGSGTQMSAPACIANAISVGAVYDANVGSQTTSCTDPSTAADQVTCFSNSNSTTDLFAPGAPTRSVKMGGGAVNKSGTSMASPLAAACAVAMLDAVPGLTPGEIRAAVKTSPVWVTDATNSLSFPRLACEAALDCVTVSAPVQISPQGTFYGDPGPLTWRAVPGAIEYGILVDSIIPAEPATFYTRTAAQVGCASGTGTCTSGSGGAPSGCG
ncbi:MAG: S8 family serine peptidase, partial [Thermoanaerobaculia bacterium]